MRLAAAAVAGWARYAEAEADEAGRPIEVVDSRRDAVTAAARRSREDPRAFLQHRELFGDLADQPRIADAVADVLTALRARGVRPVLEELLGR